VECCRALGRPYRLDLLITDEKLSYGTWRDVIAHVLASGMDTEVIVTSRSGDPTLWAEVLNRGGFDVLVEPFSDQEVDRIIRGAIGSNYLKRFASTVEVASVA